MTAVVNRQITLASRPFGFPKVSDFNLVYSPLPELAAGEVLVHSVYVSLDPSLRSRLSDADLDPRPVAIGEVMVGAAVAFVVESKCPGLRPGDVVEGMLGWQEYAAVPGRELRRIDPGPTPISTALGVLGIPGLSAFFGLLDIGHPQRGETVVVSGAAGAVGMVVGQIAKIKGCHVVGVAGPDVKAAWLIDELGFDAAVSYTPTVDFDGQLGELCPDGIDVYFDNVGGGVSDAALRRINVRARIAVCGQVSQDNLEAPEFGPRLLGHLMVKQAKAQGFLVSGYAERFPEGREHLSRWLEEGSLKYWEEIAQGIEAAPQAFIGMLQGKGRGTQLVQLSALSSAVRRPATT